MTYEQSLPFLIGAYCFFMWAFFATFGLLTPRQIKRFGSAVKRDIDNEANKALQANATEEERREAAGVEMRRRYAERHGDE